MYSCLGDAERLAQSANMCEVLRAARADPPRFKTAVKTAVARYLRRQSDQAHQEQRRCAVESMPERRGHAGSSDHATNATSAKAHVLSVRRQR
eukprot:1083124-Pyramimonas_sp.AAC.1